MARKKLKKLPLKALAWIAGVFLFFGVIALLPGPRDWLADRFDTLALRWHEHETEKQLRDKGFGRAEASGLKAWMRSTCAGVPAESCSCVAWVHGLGDQSMTWRKVLGADWQAHVAVPTELWAWDLPGSGATPPLTEPEAREGGYRVRQLARKLKQSLMAVKSCRNWTVVGNSMGGWVAAWLALDWPQGVRQLTLVNSAGFQRVKGKKSQQRVFSGDAHIESVVAELKKFQKNAYYKPRPLSDRQWRLAAQRMMDMPISDLERAQVPEEDLDGKLAQLQQRTLIIWGEADRVIALENAQRFAHEIKKSELKMLPGCGHLPQKECPEAFLNVFWAWWKTDALVPPSGHHPKVDPEHRTKAVPKKTQRVHH